MSSTHKETRPTTKPLSSLFRDPLLPSCAEYDGLLSRLCDFIGMQTGSTEGNYRVIKKVLKDQMNACAAELGVDVNGGRVVGCGVLRFELKDQEDQARKAVDLVQNKEGLLL